MKYGVVGLGLVGACVFSSLAQAQQPPDARVGFQMAIRTGYALPMGDADADSKLSDTTSGHVPFILDIGGKIIPEFFLGGFLGVSAGGAGGSAKTACETARADCSTLGVSLGIEGQYHILPHELFNPWVGYGFGYESLRSSVSRDGISVSGSAGGLQFARLMAGGDFRVSRVFGVGPFVDFSIGKYSRVSNDDGDSADIRNTGTHQWLTLGVRFVFFP